MKPSRNKINNLAARSDLGAEDGDGMVTAELLRATMADPDVTVEVAGW